MDRQQTLGRMSNQEEADYWKKEAQRDRKRRREVYRRNGTPSRKRSPMPRKTPRMTRKEYYDKMVSDQQKLYQQAEAAWRNG